MEEWFHLTQTSQPFVERLYCCFPLESTNFCSALVIALSFFLWSKFASTSRIWSPFSSHMAYIDSEIAFEVSLVTYPSSNFTSYSRVSRIGLALDLPMTLPLWSHFVLSLVPSKRCHREATLITCLNNCPRSLVLVSIVQVGRLESRRDGHHHIIHM